MTNEGKSIAEGPEGVSLVVDEDKHRVSLWKDPLTCGSLLPIQLPTIMYSEKEQEEKYKTKTLPLILWSFHVWDPFLRK